MSHALHVLVIEDEPLTAMMLVDMLSDLGYGSVEVASSAADALAMARRRRPDLVTSDVRLGQGSGPATVAALTRDGAVPIVYVTGSPEGLDPSLRPVTVIKPVCEHLLAQAIGRAVRHVEAQPDPRLMIDGR